MRRQVSDEEQGVVVLLQITHTEGREKRLKKRKKKGKSVNHIESDSNTLTGV